MFIYWLNYGLVWMIEITTSNTYILNSGRDLSKFVGVKIVIGLMRFIADGLLAGQGPNNIIRRGHMGELRDFLGVDLQLAVQKMRQIMNFCAACSKRDAFFPCVIYFNFLNQAWVAMCQMREYLAAWKALSHTNAKGKGINSKGWAGTNQIFSLGWDYIRQLFRKWIAGKFFLGRHIFLFLVSLFPGLFRLLPEYSLNSPMAGWAVTFAWRESFGGLSM